MIEHSPRLRRLIVGSMLISTFMAAIEVTVISTAMPSIVARLGGFSLFSWAFGIYLLMQAVMIPLYGRLADMYGRKPVYIASAGTFLIGSILCGFAWSMPSLILFRALQGIGGGGLAPLAITVIGDVTPAADRPRVIGYVSGIWGIASIAGPLLGALFVNSLGWPFVFWLNVPIAVTTITLVWRFLHESPHHDRDRSIDIPGSLFLVVGIGGIMVPLVQGATLSPAILTGLLAVAAVSLYGFYRREKQAHTPLLPLSLFLRPMIRAANLSTLLLGAMIIAFTAFLPTWVQGVDGRTALASGVVVGALTLAWAITGTTAGPLLGLFPHRLLALVSGCFIVIGSIGVLLVAPGQAMGWMAIPCLLIGCGMGLNNLVCTVGIQASVEHSERGRANALFYFCRLIGQALGAATFGGVLNYGMAAATTDGHDVVPGLIDPLLRAQMPAETLAHVVKFLASSLHGVFALSLTFAVGIMLVGFLVPEKQ